MTHDERVKIVNNWSPRERELVLDGLVKSRKPTENKIIIDDWIAILRLSA